MGNWVWRVKVNKHQSTLKRLFKRFHLLISFFFFFFFLIYYVRMRVSNQFDDVVVRLPNNFPFNLHPWTMIIGTSLVPILLRIALEI